MLADATCGNASLATRHSASWRRGNQQWNPSRRQWEAKSVRRRCTAANAETQRGGHVLVCCLNEGLCRLHYELAASLELQGPIGTLIQRGYSRPSPGPLRLETRPRSSLPPPAATQRPQGTAR